MKIKTIYSIIAVVALAASCSIDYKDVNSGVVKETGTAAVMNLEVRVSGDLSAAMSVSSYDLFVFNSTSAGNFLEYYSQNLPASAGDAV